MRPDIPQDLQWFKHQGSKDVYFFTRSGVVANDKIWSETHVSSSGGGGYLYNGTGNVSAPHVSSSIQTRREIWVEEDDKQQINIRCGDNVKVNYGNDVSIVYAGTPQSGYPVALVNRTTGWWHGTSGSFENIFWKNYSSTPNKKDTGFWGGKNKDFNAQIDAIDAAAKKAFASHCEAVCISLFKKADDTLTVPDSDELSIARAIEHAKKLGVSDYKLSGTGRSLVRIAVAFIRNNLALDADTQQRVLDTVNADLNQGQKFQTFEMLRDKMKTSLPYDPR